jgi:hypothetical protein
MKATATNFYVRDVFGQLSEIVNARQEIARGTADYGINWKFTEVSKDEFLKIVDADNMITCIKTKSNKFIEVDKNDISNFII